LISFFYCCANFGANDEYTVTWESLGTLGQQFQNALHGIDNLKQAHLAPTEGVMPVVVVLPVAALMMVLGSLVTRRPSAATLAKFFPDKTRHQATPSVDGTVTGAVAAPART
jgi:hypothetical protein